MRNADNELTSKYWNRTKSIFWPLLNAPIHPSVKMYYKVPLNTLVYSLFSWIFLILPCLPGIHFPPLPPLFFVSNKFCSHFHFLFLFYIMWKQFRIHRKNSQKLWIWILNVTFDLNVDRPDYFFALISFATYLFFFKFMYWSLLYALLILIHNSYWL